MGNIECFLEAQRIQAKTVPEERGWQNHAIKVMPVSQKQQWGREAGSEAEGDILSNNHTSSFYQTWRQMWKDSGSTDKQVSPASVPARCGVLAADRGHPEGPMGLQRAPVYTSNGQSRTIYPSCFSQPH